MLWAIVAKSNHKSAPDRLVSKSLTTFCYFTIVAESIFKFFEAKLFLTVLHLHFESSLKAQNVFAARCVRLGATSGHD